MIHYSGSFVHPIPISDALPTATPDTALIKPVFVFHFGAGIYLGVERYDNPVLLTVVGKYRMFEVRRKYDQVAVLRIAGPVVVVKIIVAPITVPGGAFFQMGAVKPGYAVQHFIGHTVIV